MTTLRIGDTAYRLVDPLPEFGLEVLRGEFLPAEQMGVIHPHAWECLVAVVTRITDSTEAGVAAYNLDAPAAQALFDQIVDAYTAQLERECAELEASL